MKFEQLMIVTESNWENWKDGQNLDGKHLTVGDKNSLQLLFLEKACKNYEIYISENVIFH